MTPTQYRIAIEKLGLSQRGAARFLKIDERTSRRWALGELPVPEAVAKLFRVMIEIGISPEAVE